MMMPAYYMMAAAVIGGVAVWFMSESAGRPLPGSAPAVDKPRPLARCLRRPVRGGWGVRVARLVSSWVGPRRGVRPGTARNRSAAEVPARTRQPLRADTPDTPLLAARGHPPA
ncbi:hypothetical protein LV779_17955 [Streptomyces thinghirensis]|nr:hypothetical protein [Streptomyces thinghirensis]